MFKLLAIDIVGGGVVAACLCGFLWLMAVHSDQTTREIREATRTIQTVQQELASLKNVRESQRTILQTRRAELARDGQLPEQIPLEEYFQALMGLTKQHRLKVLSHHPVAHRQYPGLLEQRYTYELSGSTHDLIRFLSEVERTSYWADVSYLKVERGHAPAGGVSDERMARLTLSLFSALPVETPTGDG